MTLETFAVALLGLIFGSFFNVCIFRLPEEKTILHGRSKCRSCKKTIPWFHNIPILSFLWLRGRSRCCNKKLSYQYPLVEIASSVLFVLLFLKFGLSLRWFCYTVFCSALLVLSVIDLHHQIIPDEISLPGIPLGFVASFLTHDITWQSSLFGILVGGGVFLTIAFLYEKFSGREGLGGGDVKLLAMLGAWLGVESILIIVVLSTFLGSIIGIGMIIARRANSKAAIPFGPFLAVAAVAFLFFKEFLLQLFFPLYYVP